MALIETFVPEEKLSNGLLLHGKLSTRLLPDCAEFEPLSETPGTSSWLTDLTTWMDRFFETLQILSLSAAWITRPSICQTIQCKSTSIKDLPLLDF